MKEASNVIVRQDAVIALHLNPRFLGRIREGVEMHLQSLLMRHNDTFGGVPVAVPKYRICSTKGLINADFPLIHCQVEAKIYVFIPTVGIKLTGTINQFSKDHVGLLVFGTFNAAISSSNMSDCYVFDELQMAWRHNKSQKLLQAETRLRFIITSFDFVDDVFSVHGRIDEADSEFVHSFLIIRNLE
jgi:hypothetical protein